MVGSLGPSLQRRNSAAAHKLSAAAAQLRKGGSIAFAGTSYLTLPSGDADLLAGTGDFTFQAWIKLSSFTAINTVVDYRPTSTQGAYFFAYVSNTGKLILYVNSVPAITGSITIAQNTWAHIAWSRNSGVMRQFVNGQLDTGITYNISTNFAAGTMKVGGGWGPVQQLTGNLTNVQFIKGQGLYPASAFGLPNAPTTPNANTKLLLNAATSAAALTDISGLNKTVTNTGTTWSSDEPF